MEVNPGLWLHRTWSILRRKYNARAATLSPGPLFLTTPGQKARQFARRIVPLVLVGQNHVQAGVPGELLDLLDMPARDEQLGCSGMPQTVRPDLISQPGPATKPGDDLADSLSREMDAWIIIAGAAKERAGGIASGPHPRGQRFGRRGWNRKPLLLPLALADDQDGQWLAILIRLNICQFEGAQLPASQPEIEQHGQDSAVSPRRTAIASLRRRPE